MLKNLTPHSVKLINKTGEVLEIPPSGKVARATIKEEEVGSIDGVPVFRTRVTGDFENLPLPETGVFFIVSAVVRTACPERKDLLSPIRLERDEKGAVVGAAGLSQN